VFMASLKISGLPGWAYLQAEFSRLPGEENPFARKALPHHSGTNQTSAASRFAFHGRQSKPMSGSRNRLPVRSPPLWAMRGSMATRQQRVTVGPGKPETSARHTDDTVPPGRHRRRALPRPPGLASARVCAEPNRRRGRDPGSQKTRTRIFALARLCRGTREGELDGNLLEGRRASSHHLVVSC
jgi:hypothetical protein